MNYKFLISLGEFDWIDGVNTFVDKDKTQGFQHLEQFVETIDKANEDTSCSPDDPDWYHFDDSTCLKIVGSPGLNFEDGLAECKKQGGKIWELEGELNNKNKFVKDTIIPDKKRKDFKDLRRDLGCSSKNIRFRLLNHPDGDGDMKKKCYHTFGLINEKVAFPNCDNKRCLFCHKTGNNGNSANEYPDPITTTTTTTTTTPATTTPSCDALYPPKEVLWVDINIPKRACCNSCESWLCKNGCELLL